MLVVLSSGNLLTLLMTMYIQKSIRQIINVTVLKSESDFKTLQI